jgi:uncharacterized membrane protein YdbT with pleckstrin-like domain
MLKSAKYKALNRLKKIIPQLLQRKQDRGLILARNLPIIILDSGDISWVFSIKKTVPPLFASLLVFVSSFFLESYQSLFLVLTRVLVGASLFILLSCELQRRSKKVWIDRYRFFVSYGIIRKHFISGPFTSEWHYKRSQDFVERIFNLWTVEIHADFVDKATLVSVPYISKKHSKKLYALLTNETQKFTSVSKSALDFEKQVLANKNEV